MFGFKIDRNAAQAGAVSAQAHLHALLPLPYLYGGEAGLLSGDQSG